MGSFLAQLGWELRKLWRRRRSHLGFVAAFVCEAALTLLFTVPSVREHMGTYVWHNTTLSVADAFSGWTSAVHVTGETVLLIGSLFLALVAGDILAKEVEEGTLRMVLSRPVSRTRILVQKLLACVRYTTALMTFIGVSALVLGLVVHGRGALAIMVAPEGIFGVLDPRVAIPRYALALVLLTVSGLTITLLAFAASCFDVKPAVATALALVLLLADDLVRMQPAFVTLRPYCLTTRLMSWRQVFNDEIPWLRIQRNYGVLLWIDLALIVTAWWAFRRRELTR
jgi:ABC-2 type transport system permease protein